MRSLVQLPPFVSRRYSVRGDTPRTFVQYREAQLPPSIFPHDCGSEPGSNRYVREVHSRSAHPRASLDSTKSRAPEKQATTQLRGFVAILFLLIAWDRGP